METTGSHEKLVVGIFETMHETQKAILAFRVHGFPISRVSVAAQELENNRSPGKD